VAELGGDRSPPPPTRRGRRAVKRVSPHRKDDGNASGAQGQHGRAAKRLGWPPRPAFEEALAQPPQASKPVTGVSPRQRSSPSRLRSLSRSPCRREPVRDAVAVDAASIPGWDARRCRFANGPGGRVRARSVTGS
jgi:hypothetical protein